MPTTVYINELFKFEVNIGTTSQYLSAKDENCSHWAAVLRLRARFYWRYFFLRKYFTCEYTERLALVGCTILAMVQRADVKFTFFSN